MSPLKMIYYGLLVICLITLFFNYKKLGKLYYWFIPLIILALGVQVSSEIMNWGLPREEKKFFLFHIYQPIEYTLLALFYRDLFPNRLLKKVILFSIPALLGFCVFYYTTNPESFIGPDFTNFTVQAGLISAWVIIFFIRLFKDPEYIKLSTYPAFWINTGNLFFYAGCLLVMGLQFYLHNRDEKLAQEIIKINHYLNLILYTLYIIAFSCHRRSIRT